VRDTVRGRHRERETQRETQGNTRRPGVCVSEAEVENYTTLGPGYIVMLVSSCFRDLASAPKVRWRARAGAPALGQEPKLSEGISPEPSQFNIGSYQGCWEAFCGTGRAFPVPVSGYSYRAEIANVSPAKPYLCRPKQCYCRPRPAAHLLTIS
jgi:hypothetical protein